MILDFPSKYVICEKLGQGSFGAVMRCVDRTTGQDYAVKMIRKNLTKDESSQVMHEMKICRKLQHPNVIRLLENFEDRNHFYMVFDLVAGGELFHEITQRRNYTEVDASHCMQQILDAVNFCHKRDIVHRDLKPENILLVSKQPGAAIKIADFGLAIEVRGNEHSWQGCAGTTLYMAPELFRKEDYGKPIDMWSIGVILFLLVVGAVPFDGLNDETVERKILAGNYTLPPHVSEEAENVIAKMLMKNSHRRITAEQALRLPWIRQAAYVAPRVHLDETIGNLKKFNARRKFKGAIIAAVAANKLLKKTPTSGLKKDDAREGNGHGRRRLKIPKDTPIDEESLREEIIKLTEKLVNAYEAGDYNIVEVLSDPLVTTFDPETGDIVEGIDYQNFFPVDGYFGSEVILLDPVVHLLGDGSACIAYVRSSEYVRNGGRMEVEEAEETMVWHKRNGKWKCVHFHTGLTFDCK